MDAALVDELAAALATAGYDVAKWVLGNGLPEVLAKSDSEWRADAVIRFLRHYKYGRPAGTTEPKLTMAEEEYAGRPYRGGPTAIHLIVVPDEVRWGEGEMDSIYVYVDGFTTSDAVARIINTLRGAEEAKAYAAYERSLWPTLRLDPVRRALRSERLTLVCGAGISVDAGIPCWGTLLNALLLQVLERRGTKVAIDAAERFQHEVGSSPLIVARHLRRLLGADFEAVVRDTLYATKPNHHTRLLEAIQTLCHATARSSVNAVITFNFDDLIEQVLDAYVHLGSTARGLGYSSIFKEGQVPERHTIPIYHVHGYLPREVAIDPEMQLVFSEEGYYEQFADPFAWSNLTILNHLTNDTCLFVGMSMTDPNLRRLLDVAHRKNGDSDRWHFIIRKRRISSDAPPPNGDAEELSQTLARTADAVEEGDRESLGVKTIWVDEFRAIPVVLRALHLESDVVWALPIVQ